MRRILIMVSGVLLLGLGSCDIPFLSADSEESGSDDGTALEVPLPWTKEDECENGTQLEIAAATPTDDADSQLTAAIYIDGEEDATNTGYHSSENGETGVLLTAETP